MRTIKELLELMLANQTIFLFGLCIWTNNLQSMGLISHDEKWLLRSYITNNRPKWYSRHYCFKSRNSRYWWPTNEIQPRIAWLKTHIKKNS